MEPLAACNRSDDTVLLFLSAAVADNTEMNAPVSTRNVLRFMLSLTLKRLEESAFPTCITSSAGRSARFPAAHPRHRVSHTGET